MRERQVAVEGPGLGRHGVVPLVGGRDHDEQAQDGGGQEQVLERAVLFVKADAPDLEHEYVENSDRDGGRKGAQADEPELPAKDGDGGLQVALGKGQDAKTDVAGIAQGQEGKGPADKAGDAPVAGGDGGLVVGHDDDETPDDDEIDDVEGNFHPHSGCFGHECYSILLYQQAHRKDAKKTKDVFLFSFAFTDSLPVGCVFAVQAFTSHTCQTRRLCAPGGLPGAWARRCAKARGRRGDSAPFPPRARAGAGRQTGPRRQGWARGSRSRNG